MNNKNKLLSPKVLLFKSQLEVVIFGHLTPDVIKSIQTFKINHKERNFKMKRNSNDVTNLKQRGQYKRGIFLQNYTYLMLKREVGK